MKRIIICADGTWNIRDQIDKATGKRHATNVTKIARSVLSTDANGIDQIVFYHDGVGTRRGLDKITGGAFGEGIQGNIRDIYRFIVYNYSPGDEIFLFGFSRGAFTVRTLAGFMNKVGLVTKGDDYCVPDLYACYENSVEPNSPEWIEAFKDVRNPRPCPPIKFIGVWDTVGALGAPGLLGQVSKWFNHNKYRFHDVDLNDHIQNAVHALAIDERRSPFKPNIWTRPPQWSGSLVQAWFAGVHSNVGGGYVPDGLANEALHWMVEQAAKCGLSVDSNYLAPFLPCFNSILQNSYTPGYWVFGSYSRPIGEHLADGETIHQSAVDRLKLADLMYQPSNLESFLKTSPPDSVTNTSRVARGTPCRPEPPSTRFLH
jgi:uncharacterized protein (DUF2235 family)